MSPNQTKPRIILITVLFLFFSASLPAFEDFPYGLHSDAELLHFGVLGALTALNFLVLWEMQETPTGQEKIDGGYEFDKDDLNPVDCFFMTSWNSGISRTGDVMLCLTAAGTGSALLSMPGLDRDERVTLGVMLTELLMWNLNAQFLLKYSFPRYRPYNYSSSSSGPVDKPDSRESFPSGHAMYAVSSAVFFHTVYKDIRPAGPDWPVWAAYAAATGTAALRMASGRHFASDVLIGSAIGACIGYLIPLQNRLIHSSRRRNQARMMPLFTGNTPGIGLSYTY